MTQEDVSTETLGSNIRNARFALGWSVDQLAEKADLASEVVRKVEHGGHCADGDLLALSRALGMPLPVLVPDHARDEDDGPTIKKKWPMIVVTLLFLLVAVRTLLSSLSQ
ncbi:helix-turn-helix domain-containing protein [Kordiimonas sp.]|uniref:helix-turn-helix domain-containing protein n=1 Tax=Kordiimonas sp. TaxID=1970157 RepID=UPI003A912BF7